MLSPALRTLLDDARAEAKRAGHPVATPLHLAAALARRAPEAFEAAFGHGAAAEVRVRLLGGMPAGTEQETLALLEAAKPDDPAPLLAALHERIGALDASPVDQLPPVQAERPDPVIPPSPHPAPGALLAPVPGDPSITGFEEVVDHLTALLSMRDPGTPLVRGPSGSGKTTMLAALAARLSSPGYDGPLRGIPVTRVDTTAVLSEDPVQALDRALDSHQQQEILAVDDLESLLSLGAAASILPMLSRLRGAVCDPRARLILMLDDAYASRLEAVDQDLAALLEPIELPEPAPERLWEIGAAQASELAAHHGVTLPDPVVRAAASPRAAGDRRAHPGLMIDRLDRACARAALRPERIVTEADLGLGATPEIAPLDAARLTQALRERVRGQDQALVPVADRLALTRAQLDLRPARPDGVFLFVGPTGVGKTELARALCQSLFGSEDRLIRLDMSEYAEPWALSRLIGPQPGYVGFTEPESWLTTRIRRQPDTVLLLDEVEKAHPAVWNAFLQVFDAGRLSDARGAVANFEHTVIVMTSNLGGQAFGSTPVGFAAADSPAADEGRVLEAVRRAMPPELINRLDEIVVFHPLSPEAIDEIAGLELARVRDRLAQRGYEVTFADGVRELVARTGYDPAYGARHLQRNIERLLLEPLAGLSDRRLTAEPGQDGQVRWRTS